MSHINPVEAVLFDLDGTLIDSAPDLHAAANRLLAENGRRPVSLLELTGMVGDGVPKLVERAFRATGAASAAGAAIGDGGTDALAERFLELYEPRSAELTVVFPGAVACLERLRGDGYRLAICTNKPYDATLGILDSLGLSSFFEVVVGGDSLLGIKKPDPRHLLAALEKLGVDADRAIMIGDNANDVNAARGAGIPVIVCRFGYTKGPAEDLDGDLIIDHFDELADTVNRCRSVLPRGKSR